MELGMTAGCRSTDSRGLVEMEGEDEKDMEENKFPDSSSWLRFLFPVFYLFFHFCTFFFIH